jgi:hypothetical protein
MDDQTLIATYEAFDTPVDQFLGNPKLTEAFVETLRNRVGNVGMGSEEIMKRLVYLRKRGRLPRLRRNYYGRGASNN